MLLLLFALMGWCHATPNSPAWLNLLHYQKTLTGFVSEADGPDFFLAPDGKTNPQAEWQASLEALRDSEKRYGKLKLPAACVYVSRKKLLERLTGESFPAVECPDYEQWRRGLPVDKVSLVFATAYPNNPASMFGHTFLRLNGPGEGNTLLDYAVNFAATTGEDGGVEFALLGVFGGYEGHYSLAPYFIKVNEYNHGEARDLWEYPLTLSPEAIDLLLAHLWELEASTHFDYYFFDENCSWQIVRLLEAADPTLKLSRELPFYVIPGSTVRAISRSQRLGGPVLRPSLRRSFLARPKPQNDSERLDHEIERLRLKARLNSFDLEEREHYHALLSQRADDPTPARPAPQVEAFNRPDQGHDPRRVEFLQGDGFRSFGVRLAQHDLLDSDLGHESWSMLDVIRATVEETEGRVFLRSLWLVDVVSLHPQDGLTLEPSWYLRAGVRSVSEFYSQDPTGSLDVGLGQSFGGRRLIMGGFLAARVLGNTPFQEGLWAGGGARALIGLETRPVKWLLSGERLWGRSGDMPWRYEAAMSWAMADQWALRVLHGRIHDTFDRTWENSVSLLHYF